MLQPLSNFVEGLRYFFGRHPYLALFLVYLILLGWLNFVISDMAWGMGWPLTWALIAIVPLILFVMAIRQYLKSRRQSNVLSFGKNKRIQSKRRKS